MELTVGTAEQYAAALEKLLPEGEYWNRIKSDADGDVRLVLGGMAEDVRAFRLRMTQLLLEAFPETANETLGDWERVRLGRTHEEQPTEYRRAMVVRGADFNSVHAVAARFGVEIEMAFPFRCGCFGTFRCGRQRLGAQNVLSVVEVAVFGGENIADGGRELFEGAVSARLLANHVAFFKYTYRDGASFSSVDEIARATKTGLRMERPYQAARFGRAMFGRTRIAGLYLGDIAFVRIDGHRAAWRRNDVEDAVVRVLRYAKVFFVYGSEAFPRLMADCREFSTLAEISAYTGIALSARKPYGRAVFGRGRCGAVSPTASGLTFVEMGGYGSGYRRTDIERAVLKFRREYETIYFIYGKEAIHGYVS